MEKKITITIDGSSSCGKSTLAKHLAKKLNYLYVDSGAMYRAVTLYFLRNHVDWSDIEKVKFALNDIKLQFFYNHKSSMSEIWLNGENVEYLIRELVIAEKVSDVAAIREVREVFQTFAQRRNLQWHNNGNWEKLKESLWMEEISEPLFFLMLNSRFS